VAIADPSPEVLDSSAAGGLAIRGGALRTLGHGLAMLMSLASVPFMTRHLGPVDYGYFVTVTAIIFILGGLTEAGISYLGVREYAVRDAAGRETLLRNLVGLRLGLTITGILFAVAITALTGAPEVVVLGTMIAGVGLLLSLTQQTYMVPLSAQLRLGVVTLLEVLKMAVLSGTIIALVVVGASLLPFFFASVAAGLVMLVCTLLVLRKESGLLPAFDRAEWWRLLRAVLPYAVAVAAGLVYFRLAVVLLSYVGTERETGIYSAAFRVVETLAVAPMLLAASAFPILARAAGRDAERLRYALQRMFEVSVLLGVGCALATAIGAQFAIDVIAGDQFQESVGVLRLQALSLATAFLVATWSFALLSLERFRGLLLANLVAALVSASLTVLLASPLGPEGAALATVGAEAVLALALLVVLVRGDASLAPRLGRVARLVPGTVGAVAVGVLLPLHPALLVLLASLVYLGGALACGAIPPEAIDALRRRDRAT
jgi:O-antigen/teichoic acid export membrane protein